MKNLGNGLGEDGQTGGMANLGGPTLQLIYARAPRVYQLPLPLLSLASPRLDLPLV